MSKTFKKFCYRLFLIGMSLFLIGPFVGARQMNNYHFFVYDSHTHRYELVKNASNYVQAHASQTHQSTPVVSNSKAINHLDHEIKLQKQTIKDLQVPPMTKHDHTLVNQLTSQVNKEEQEKQQLEKSHQSITLKAPTKKKVTHVTKKYYKSNNNSGVGSFWFWMWILNDNNYYGCYNPYLMPYGFYNSNTDDTDYYSGTNGFDNHNSFNDVETGANDDNNTDNANGVESASVNDENQNDNSVNINAISEANSNANDDLASGALSASITASNLDDDAMDASIASDDADEASESDDTASTSSVADDSAEESASADDEAMGASSSGGASVTADDSTDSVASTSTTSSVSGGTSGSVSSGSSDGGGDASGGADGTIIAPVHFVFHIK